PHKREHGLLRLASPRTSSPSCRSRWLNCGPKSLDSRTSSSKSRRCCNKGSAMNSARATTWRLRTRSLQLGRRPLVMGIVNVTPDSFSDGGQFFDPATAVPHALRLLDEGADVLDIGGESTRPYSAAVSLEEELRRVIPVIESVHRQRPEAIISVDTS